MMLGKDTNAPIPPKQPSQAGAIIGRWCVILIFSAVVAAAVWQYRENQRLTFELSEAALDTADAQALLETERALNRNLLARLKEVTEATSGLVTAVERGNATMRQIAPASAQYSHSTPTYVASQSSPRVINIRTTTPTVRSSTPPPRVVPAYTPPQTPEVPVDRIQAAIKTRVDRYYKAQRHNGSGSTLVFRVECEFGEPREIPGWAGRYEVKGEVWYQYYDSVWGGSFSRGTGSFTAEARVTGTRVEVVDFTAR